MNIWTQLGFTENPYSSNPIPSDDTGGQLLVGRDIELQELMMSLASLDIHPTLEGPNGVGKTSLVAVAGYMLRKMFIDRKSEQAVIPLSHPFQLNINDDVSTFKRNVFQRVARAFIENHALLKDRGLDVPDIAAVNSWLSAPVFNNLSAGGNIAGAFGASAGQSTTVNSSVGFSEEGFISTVTGWLNDCFPTATAGFFVCTIDNLELLETSAAVKEQLESLRDEVIRINGLRWVLCGARGVVRGAAYTHRLAGVLAEPIELHPIADEFISPLIQARLDAYSIDSTPLTPVEADSFLHLYHIGNKNLRNAMKYSQDFSIWAVKNKIDMKDSVAKRATLEDWMTEVARKTEADTIVGKRALRVFHDLADAGGIMKPNQFTDFGFQSYPAMHPHLKALAEANLIESEIDGKDNRKKTISIVSNGWIVNYIRRNRPVI